jgi:secreted trypsin-like serine protease
MKAKLLSISMLLAVSAIPAAAHASGLQDSLSTVQLVSSTTGSTICGGALISGNTVLTTATCVDGKSVASFKVKIGNATNGYTVLPVQSYVEHQGYGTGACTHGNNIAVVHISVPAALLATIPLAHVPAGRSLAPGATALWFGNPQPTSTYGTRMRYYTMTEMSVASANLKLQHVPGANVCALDLPAMMSDATSLPGGAGTMGMAGAPLYSIGGWDSVNYVLGLESWSVSSTSYPYVFTDVGAYADWIAANSF